MQRAVSIFDLLIYPESRAIVASEDREQLNQLLFSIGFDISKEIEEEVCWHRPLYTNELVYGIRWAGSERIDQEWLESKWCTFDNRLERIGLKDVELQRDLLKMCTVPSIMEKMIASMNDIYGVSPSEALSSDKEKEDD